MHDQNALNQELRDHIEKGMSLEDAVRLLHKSGVGSLFLCQAVATAAHMEMPVAQRLVVRAIQHSSG